MFSIMSFQNSLLCSVMIGGPCLMCYKEKILTILTYLSNTPNVMSYLFQIIAIFAYMCFKWHALYM